MSTLSPSASLSRKIDAYNHLENKDEASELYLDIVSQIMVMIYNIPQKYMHLNEEDASDFLLFMENKLPRIISNYDIKEADFSSYLFPILYKKLNSYNLKKSKDRAMENVILNQHTLYESILEQEHNLIQTEVSDLFEETTILKKLKYLSQSSRTAKRRIFIYFLSRSPSFSATTILNLCKSMGYDVDQTFYLSDKVKACMKRLPQLEEVCQKRNKQWANLLYYQSIKDPKSDDVNRVYMYKYNLDVNNKTLSDRKFHGSRKQMSQILGITEGSAGSALNSTAKIIALCNGKLSCTKSSEYYGLNRKLIQTIVNGTWINAKLDSKKETFYPFKEFNIKKSVEHKQ